MKNFDQMLEKYAKLVVNVGLNLQPKQRLTILSGIKTAQLVRAIAKEAYQNGAPLVNVVWSDEETEKIRYEFAPRDSFEEFPVWVMEGLHHDAKRGDAFLSMTTIDPDLMSGFDPEAVGTALKTRAKHFKPALNYISNGGVQWTVVRAPTPEWATKIFPDSKPDEAVEKLWETLFKLCRLDNDDPVAVWQAHLANLEKRHQYFNEKQFTTLHYQGPGTDLKVGLPENHIWKGGAGETQDGIPFTANLPTEEIFSMPHKDRVEGTVRATKPLNYYGNLIENFSLTFEKGRVIHLEAEKGEEALRKLLETDENAKQLGEVALVPHHSPISQSGLIYYNTLYDENASSHLALGSAYKHNIENGTSMTDEELDAAGVNDSLIHVDFMIGSDQIDLDGITRDGKVLPLMRSGEWAFDV